MSTNSACTRWSPVSSGWNDVASALPWRTATTVTSSRVARNTTPLPVPNFSAGGIATPADASLVMQLGAEAVFVGSGIFKSSDPAARAKAIVQAAKNYDNPEQLLEASRALGDAMPGLDIAKLPEGELLQTRGW